MALSRPPVLPTFSTDATYPAGASPWSGQPPRVAPSGTVLARGFTPQADLAAEFLNYLHGVSLDFVKYLDSWWNPPLVANNLPQLRFLDAAGNGRSIVDHNGFAGLGRVSQFLDSWGITPGATGSQWATVLGTAATVTVLSPATSYNAPFVKFLPSTTAGAANYALIWAAPIIIPNTAGMSFVLEFEFGLNTAAAGTTSNTSWFIGLASGADPINDANLITLKKAYNVANYNTCVDDGGVQNISALTVPTAPTAGVFPTDRMRIEIQGSGSPYAAYQAKFWINEVLVSTVTSRLPGAVAMKLTFGCSNEGGAPTGSPLGYIGPVFATWNRFTSGPNL